MSWNPEDRKGRALGREFAPRHSTGVSSWARQDGEDPQEKKKTAEIAKRPVAVFMGDRIVMCCKNRSQAARKFGVHPRRVWESCALGIMTREGFTFKDITLEDFKLWEAQQKNSAPVSPAVFNGVDGAVWAPELVRACESA